MGWNLSQQNLVLACWHLHPNMTQVLFELVLVNVRCCPRLALGTLFKDSSDPHIVTFFWALLCPRWASVLYKCGFLSGQGSGVGALMTEGTA